MLRTIFFLLGGQKMNLLRTGKQNPLYDPLVEKCFSRFAHGFFLMEGSKKWIFCPVRNNQIHFFTHN